MSSNYFISNFWDKMYLFFFNFKINSKLYQNFRYLLIIWLGLFRRNIDCLFFYGYFLDFQHNLNKFNISHNRSIRNETTWLVFETLTKLFFLILKIESYFIKIFSNFVSLVQNNPQKYRNLDTLYVFETPRLWNINVIIRYYFFFSLE